MTILLFGLCRLTVLARQVYSYMTFPRAWAVNSKTARFESEPIYDYDISKYETQLNEIPYHFSSGFFDASFISEMAQVFFKQVTIRVSGGRGVDLEDFLARPLPSTSCSLMEHIRRLKVSIYLPNYGKTHPRGTIHFGRGRVDLGTRLWREKCESEYVNCVAPLSSILGIRNSDRLEVCTCVHAYATDTFRKFKEVLGPIVFRMKDAGMLVSVSYSTGPALILANSSTTAL
jgi:hypothetical protein